MSHIALQYTHEQFLRVLAPWFQIVSQADSFFARVSANHSSQLQCAPGCVSCCHPDLAVLLSEALAILIGLDLLDGPRRATLRRAAQRRAAQDDAAGCPLLADGLCQVYLYRPIICRTHGLPIWLPDEPGTTIKLTEVSCCPLNFTEAVPEQGVILNGTLLNAGLTVADAMVRDALSLTSPRRYSMRQLVLEGWTIMS